MNNKDILERFIFANTAVRGEIVHLDQSFQTIMNQHKYPPVIRKLLGEALAATCLLFATIKFDGRLSVQFQGKGKLKLLLAQCDQDFHLRGLARFDNDLSEADLESAIGDGILTITMEPSSGGQRYQGIVAWQGGSLAHAIEGYFRDSEQLPTRIWFAVNETGVAGLLLQALPEAGLDKSSKVTGDLDWENLVHLTSTITNDELLNLPTPTLLHRLYFEEDIQLFPSVPVTFRCRCSVERSENAIRILGREEVEEELREKQKIVVTCEFCNREYEFDRVDIEKIFKKGDNPPTSTQIH